MIKDLGFPGSSSPEVGESSPNYMTMMSIPNLPIPSKREDLPEIKIEHPKDRNRRPSRFSTNQKKELSSASVDESSRDGRKSIKPSKGQEAQFSHFEPEFNDSEYKQESAPFARFQKRPSIISTVLRRPHSKRLSKDSVRTLSPSQISLIDDKVLYTDGRTKPFINSSPGPKVRRSKLLDRISLIAARGSFDDGKGESPALIFKQVLVITS